MQPFRHFCCLSSMEDKTNRNIMFKEYDDYPMTPEREKEIQEIQWVVDYILGKPIHSFAEYQKEAKRKNDNDEN